MLYVGTYEYIHRLKPVRFCIELRIGGRRLVAALSIGSMDKTEK